MKKLLVTLLSASLLVPSASAFANPLHNQSEDVTEGKVASVLTEDAVMKIVTKQLAQQNASPESYAYFTQRVQEHFSKQQGVSIQGVDDLVYASKGGEVYYDLYYGNLFGARIEDQYLSPSATLKLINDYKDGELTTWNDVYTTLIGFLVGVKFPIIGTIISAYGALSTIGSYLDAETIRSIERAGGQSVIMTYTTSRGKDTVWVPWNYYPYFEVPEFDQYTKNITYTVYK
ncbi:hypothetical protein [Paenibacillus sp. DYY-L-2]|uniref:hypothetical protein n=1 Tax=Paenibacillus sp. DYY-L-2 TaxID=3447013 RepID=UPI003F501136